MFPHSRASQKAASSSDQSATIALGVTSLSAPSTTLPTRSSTASLETALHLLRQERKQIRNGHGVSAYAYASKNLLVTPTKGAQSGKMARKKVKAKTVKPSSSVVDDLDGQEADTTFGQDADAVEKSIVMEDDELDAEGEEDSGTQASDALLALQKEGDGDGDEAGEAPKQNVAVCVRVRSTNRQEEEEMWKYDSALNRIMPSDQHPTMLKRNTTATASGEMATVSEDGAYSFKYDSLVPPTQMANEMYDEQIAPIVSAVTRGYNGTVFAYGQTGSGKTYTMSGSGSGLADDNAELGVIPRAIRQIFDDVEKATKREFLVRVSYLEIYNETLNDLLASLPSLSSVSGSQNDADGRPSSPIKGGSSHTVSGAANSTGLTLKMFESGGRVQIQGLREEIVTKPEQVLQLLDRGQTSRHQAATDWNERSSRSHCVFILTVESRDKTNRASSSSSGVRLSQLNLIDLAGSERAASEKDRRKEGAFINKSLLTLGTVIAKLSEQCASGKEEAHIPYRDSKLTRLLQTSLSGNARVAVICTVSPLKEHAVESLSTLRFGQRCKMVVTSAKQGSVVDDKALIARYKRELDKLRAQLEVSHHGAATSIPASSSIKALRDEKAHAEQEVRDMNVQRAALKQQIEHLTRLILTGKEVEAAQSSSDGSDVDGERRERALASRRSDLGTSSPSKLSSGRFQSTPKNDDLVSLGHSGRSFAKPFAVEAELASLRKSVTKALAAKQASEEARRREVQLWQAKVSELEEANREAEEELDEAEEAFKKLKEERDAMRKQVTTEREAVRKQLLEEREANRLLKLVAKSRTTDLTEEQRRDILSTSQCKIEELERKLAEKGEAEIRMKKEIDALRTNSGSDDEVEVLKREIEELRTQLAGQDNRSFATAADEEDDIAMLRGQLRHVEAEKSKLLEELRATRLDHGKDEAEREFADLIGSTGTMEAIERMKKQIKDEKAKRADLALQVEHLKKAATSNPASASLRRAEEKCKALEQQVERLTQDLERSSFAQRLANPSPPLSSAGSSSASVEHSPRMTEMQLENEEQWARIASLERQLDAARAQNEEGSTLQAGPFRSSFASRLSRGGSVRQYKKYDTEAADLAGTPTGSSSGSSIDVQRAVKAEREEIERLNEVISSQRGIMTDLEGSVATWKKRLRLQQEIIAKLVESGMNASPSLIAQSETIAVADTPGMTQIARKANVDVPDLRRTPSTLSAASSGPYYGAHLYNKPPTTLGAAAHGLGLGSNSPTKGSSWLATMPGHRPDMSVSSTDSTLTPRSINRHTPLPQPQSNARNLAAQDRRRTIDHEIASLKGSPRVESTKYRLLEPQMRSPAASPDKIGRGPLPVVPGSPPKTRPTKDWYI